LHLGVIYNSTMEINAYLERIRYEGFVKPDTQTLYGLHLTHMLAVPFENLDIELKRTIHLNKQAIWDKIIINNRGGFCYELNGLFAWLLKQIGFKITYLNARVFNRTGKLGSDFDHLTLLVQIPSQPEHWLADVGFGDSFTEPLVLDEQGEQIQGLRAYRLEQTSDGYVMWQKTYAGNWERQYFFDLQPHRFPEEYLAGCQYHQTSPKSSFTHKNIISRATKDGRISLEDDRLIMTRNGEKMERAVNTEEEYCALLNQHFGVTLQKENL